MPGAPQKDKSQHRERLDLESPKNQKEDKKTNAKTGVFELDWGLPRLYEIEGYFLLKKDIFFVSSHNFNLNSRDYDQVILTFCVPFEFEIADLTMKK